MASFISLLTIFFKYVFEHILVIYSSFLYNDCNTKIIERIFIWYKFFLKQNNFKNMQNSKSLKNIK